MNLEKNEYTYASLLQFLSKKHGTKLSGEEFTASDICQYKMRGYLPHRYGGNKLTCAHVEGITILTIHENKKVKGKKIKSKKTKSEIS